MGKLSSYDLVATPELTDSVLVLRDDGTTQRMTVEQLLTLVGPSNTPAKLWFEYDLSTIPTGDLSDGDLGVDLELADGVLYTYSRARLYFKGTPADDDNLAWRACGVYDVYDHVLRASQINVPGGVPNLDANAQLALDRMPDGAMITLGTRHCFGVYASGTDVPQVILMPTVYTGGVAAYNLRGVPSLVLYTNGAADDVAYMVSSTTYGGAGLHSVTFRVSHANNVTVEDSRIWLGMFADFDTASLTDDLATPTPTLGVGFRRRTWAENWFAVSYDGVDVAQTETDCGLASGQYTNEFELKIVFTHTATIEFWIDGTLRATHAASGYFDLADLYLAAGICAPAGGTKSFHFRRAYGVMVW